MDLITLLTVIAFLIIAAEIAGRDRHPMVMVAGLGLLALALFSRLLSGDGFFETTVPLFFDMGVSLLLAGGWLVLRKARANPGPFLMLGAGSLLVAGLLYGGGYLWSRAGGEEASLLLELGPDDRLAEVEAVLDRYDARAERAFPGIDLATDEDLAQVYLIYGDPATFDALATALRADAENVDFVEPNRVIRLVPLAGEAAALPAERRYLENDPLVNQQWGLEAIHGHEAHALLQDHTPARKARVAIIDTGVDARHEDVRQVFGESPGTTDTNGHGTHCAGIAGAATNNGVGVASLNWEGRYIEVISYPGLGSFGAGTLESISQAILDAARAGADVISMSFGDVAPTPPRVLTEALAFAQRRGAILVASAGNSNEDATTHFPSNIDGVIAVAAVDQQLNKARFSNTVGRLPHPLAAPGVDILSLAPGHRYKPLSGTSMATPMVAGVLGVLRALNPDLSAEDAYRLLHETGTTVPHTDRVGRVVNAEAAIQTMLAAM